MKSDLPLSSGLNKGEKRASLSSMTLRTPIKTTLACALLFGATHTALAATSFTLTLAPPGPIGAAINTNISYTATLTETGTTASTGTTTVRSTLPLGMTFISGGAGTSGFTCTYATATRIVTCTRATSIARNVPVLIPLTISSTTIGTKSVSMNVSGGGSAGTITSNAVSTVISTLPPTAFSVALTGPLTGMTGSQFAYTATVTNTSVTASTGTTVLKSTLPAGLTFVSGSSLGGFTCSAALQVVTCSNAAVIVPNTPDTLTLTVNPTTAGAKIVSANVSGGGSVGTATSNSITTTLTTPPDLAVTIRQPSPVLTATTMSQVEVRVTNAGGNAASAPINATFTLPATVSAPLKFSRIADHWVCKTSGQTVSCSYDQAIAAGMNTRLRIPVTPAVAGALATPFIASVAPVVNETNLVNNGPVNMTPAAAVAAWVAPVGIVDPQYSTNILDPTTITKYALPLPNPTASFFKHIPDTASVPGTDSYSLTVGQVNAQILPPGFRATPVYAYGDPARPDTFTYPAHTIEARSTHVSNTSGLGKPVKVQYQDSRLATITSPHLLPVDHTIHGAMAGRLTDPFGVLGLPNGTTNPGVLEPDVRSIAHLHGAQVIDQSSDGYSEAWHSPAGVNGIATSANPTVPYNPNPFDYTNNQEGTMLWYHDHTLGITRLNVYAGMAGLYMIRDDNEMAMIANNQLPSGRHEVPLVLQDRMFKTTGELAYPDIDVNTGLGSATAPSMSPEFFGNVMVVNGAAWPYLQVEPRKYRLRILNGSNARVYTLAIQAAGVAAPISFQVIGTEGGFLNQPTTVTSLTVSPAERYDIIVDFSTLLGQNITLTNSARVPFGRTAACPAAVPGGNTGGCAAPGVLPIAGLTDQVMQFRVNVPMSAAPLVTIPATLRAPIAPLVATDPAALPHQVLLGEKTDGFLRVNPILGTVADGFLDWTSPMTEQPFAHTVENWEIFNSSVDAHPVHIHDGAFQVIERQAFSAILGANGTLTNICYSATPQTAGNPVCPAATPASPPLVTEQGWKETVIAYPAESYNVPGAIGEIVQGQVTRVRMKFEGIGQFVWHCHIAEHEDHDMMRPMLVH